MAILTRKIIKKPEPTVDTTNEDVQKFVKSLDAHKGTKERSASSSTVETTDEEDLDSSNEDKEDKLAYDFGAWFGLRKSVPREKQKALRVSISRNQQPEDDGSGAGLGVIREGDSEETKHEEMKHASHDDADDDDDDDDDHFVSSLSNYENLVAQDQGLDEALQLTEQEKIDISAWKCRLDFEMAYDKTYMLEEYEQKEMDSIVDFLGLQDSESNADYLSNAKQQVTRKAIKSIFFPLPTERHSILLKRGPVLFGGEERELMLFTNGFLLSHVEVDALVNLLLDVGGSSTEKVKGGGASRRLSSNELCAWRFSEMDKDGSGALDRGEIHDFFRAMGMSLSDAILDAMLLKFDRDSDGTVTFDEFKKLMQELEQVENKNKFWNSMRGKMKKTLTKSGVTRKLDVAFRMSDVERIENLSVNADGDDSRSMLVGKEMAPLTFAIYLKDVSNPLVVTGSKPGHMEAWVSAFNRCSKFTLPEEEDDADDVGEDESSDEEDIAYIDKMNVKYDLAASRNFRQSLDMSSLQRSNEERFELTEEEVYDNKAWRMRMQTEEVFCKGYKPKKWEKKEIEATAEFLKIQNPHTSPMYLNEPDQQLTRNAIAALFYQEPHELQSVLLKRGPVMIGEEERELMLFTHGCLFSHVELDMLVNLLLDASSGNLKMGEEDLTAVEFCQRQFNDIDTDGSGTLDRHEIGLFFRGMGMALSDTMLDGLMKKFDFDEGGTVSFGEFKTMVLLIQEEKENENNGSFWKTLGGKVNQADDGVTRKLDCAFQMSDIDRVENIGTCGSYETKMLVEPELEKLTFVLYLKDVPDPLVVRCSKPGHVEAWVDAFRKCFEFDAQKDVSQLLRPEWASSSIDWGDDDSF